MEIQVISDNQIRCTLTSSDLRDRGLSPQSMFYGQEGTEALFTEVVDRAVKEYNFDFSSGPYSIQAIPQPEGSLELIITKVDNPEELDSRFSSFVPQKVKGTLDITPITKEVLAGTSRTESNVPYVAPNLKEAPLVTRVYAFKDLNTCIEACVAAPEYKGESCLFKDEKGNKVYLIVHCSNIEETIHNYNLLSNTLIEFGNLIKTNSITLGYYKTHHKLMIEHNAVNILKGLAK